MPLTPHYYCECCPGHCDCGCGDICPLHRAGLTERQEKAETPGYGALSGEW